MDASREGKRRVEVPQCRYNWGVIILVSSIIILLALDARARDLGTIASALGLYSAGLLGVFSVLTAWRSAIVARKYRYLQVEERWLKVIDRAVLFSLKGSILAFLIMLFAVIAPAVKVQLAELLPFELYEEIARWTSAAAITGVVLLGLMALQMVIDVSGVYAWNAQIEEDDAAIEAQRRKGPRSN